MDVVNATKQISMNEMKLIEERERKSAKLSENQTIQGNGIKKITSAEPDNRDASLVAELTGKGTILNILV